MKEKNKKLVEARDHFLLATDNAIEKIQALRDVLPPSHLQKSVELKELKRWIKHLQQRKAEVIEVTDFVINNR